MTADKLKFILWTVGGVIFSYLILTACMPVINDFADIGITEVIAEVDNISDYVGAVEGLQYMPLLLYFIPGVIGLAAIVWKLKFSKG